MSALRDVMTLLTRRPWIVGDDGTVGAMLPLPWIVQDAEPEPAWTDFISARSEQAALDRLCQVCGFPLATRAVAFAMPTGRSTSGPPTHPSCALLALRFCPSLPKQRGDDVIGWWIDVDRDWWDLHSPFTPYDVDQVYTDELLVPERCRPIFTRREIAAGAA